MTSPAQDPIDAAVDAHLKPLGDELKAFGHKLEEQDDDERDAIVRERGQ